jgi:hypothetical protein
MLKISKGKKRMEILIIGAVIIVIFVVVPRIKNWIKERRKSGQ